VLIVKYFRVLSDFIYFVSDLTGADNRTG